MWRAGLFFLVFVMAISHIVGEEIDLTHKNQLPEQELKKKKEDGYFTFIAGPASSPDTGVAGTGVV